MTLEESLAGKDIPEEIKRAQVLLDIPYLSFEEDIRTGQLVIHIDLVKEIELIFKELLERKFPIEKMVPVAVFNWNDNTSMAANNTSGFNYRTIFGTMRFSHHATGRAIDINPALNPYVRGVFIAPPGAVYDTKVRGTVTEEIAELFKKRGWEWGGDWTLRKDWQHFEKP